MTPYLRVANVHENEIRADDVLIDIFSRAQERVGVSL
jgi:hypothetical protein